MRYSLYKMDGFRKRNKKEKLEYFSSQTLGEF